MQRAGDDNPHYLETYAMAQHANGRTNEARGTLQRAMNGLPEDDARHAWLTQRLQSLDEPGG